MKLFSVRCAMEIYYVLLLLAISSISGRVSVLLNDPNNICSENEGSHVLPGAVVTLLCVVNNTGAFNKVLIWITPGSPYSHLILSNGTRYQSNSMFSSTATFNGDLANATLTFTATQSLDDEMVICTSSLGNLKSCTLLIYIK